MAVNPPLLETRQLSVGIGDKVFCRDLDLTLHAGAHVSIARDVSIVS